MTAIKSLVWATDIDVLADDRRVERRRDHWVVTSPSNPTYWWGNFLLFDAPPAPGDGPRWQAAFAAAFAERPEVNHMTFAWDRTDGELGAAEGELVPLGFQLEPSVGMIAAPDAIRPHARANAEVEVIALGGASRASAGDEPGAGRVRVAGGDEADALWEQVLALQLAQAPGGGSAYHLSFLRSRQAGLRQRFRSSHGFWYVAVHDGNVLGSLGIVVTDGRARYQTVDTSEAHRGRGIATRLVVEAAQHTAAHCLAAGRPVERFVIVADPDYHAALIYESVGFERVERVTGAQRKPPGQS